MKNITQDHRITRPPRYILEARHLYMSVFYTLIIVGMCLLAHFQEICISVSRWLVVLGYRPFDTVFQSISDGLLERGRKDK